MTIPANHADPSPENAPGATPLEPEPPESLRTELVGETAKPYLEFRDFWTQRSAIIRDPDLSLQKLQTAPLKFAVYITLLPSVLIGIVQGTVEFFGAPPVSQAQRTLHALQVAEDRCEQAMLRYRGIDLPGATTDFPDLYHLELVNIPDLPAEFKGAAAAVLDPKTLHGLLRQRIEEEKLVIRGDVIKERFSKFLEKLGDVSTPLVNMFAAVLFARALRRFTPEYPRCRFAARVYLYYVSARLAVPSIVGPCMSEFIKLTAPISGRDAADVQMFDTLISGLWIAWVIVVLTSAARVEMRRIFAMDTGSLRGKPWVIWWAIFRAEMTAGAVAFGFIAVLCGGFFVYFRARGIDVL